MVDEKNIVEEQKGRAGGIPTLDENCDVACPASNRKLNERTW